jgi:two-component system NtrC family response regulator
MSETRHSRPLRGRVVILDDEANMGRILVKTLTMEGLEARAFNDPRAGLEAIGEFQPDVLLTDMRMPGMTGMDVLRRARRDWPDLPILVITAFGTVEGAVEAMREGAFNYITKPFEPGNLLAQIARALEHRRMTQENARLSEQFAVVGQEREIVGQGKAIEQLRDLIARSAPTDSSVLVTGKSGVGKELVARAIHAQSHRAAGRFVAINCPSIPVSLIESEMFGHERGAFTGADRSKMGLIELAQGGTLFLDEVAELPPEMQVKLLRVLQEREIQRVGGLSQIPVDIRVVAATNRDLPEEMRAGRFREDLFYRLNVIHIEIPPLRERPEDLPLLAEHILTRIGRRMSRHGLRLSEASVRVLAAYAWPGNVRELENVLERAVVLAAGDVIEPVDLAIDFQGPPGESATDQEATFPGTGDHPMSVDYRSARDDFERHYLRKLIKMAGGNMTRAARVSGISRRNLYEKLERVGLADDLIRKR